MKETAASSCATRSRGVLAGTKYRVPSKTWEPWPVGQEWYLTSHYWPTSQHTHVFEGTLYFVSAKTPRERVAHELAAVSFKEYGLQDANTLEATQTMLESRVLERFPLNDQEVLCRHLHKVVGEWVDEYKKLEEAGV